MTKAFKSEVVDGVIVTLEDRMKVTGKHLMKTDTIFEMCQNHIDLSDDLSEREELLEIGMRQVIQSRLYAHNYYSVDTGYFVNLDECNNLGYLNMIIKGKDETIETKIEVRNKIKRLKELNGQMKFIPDNNNTLTWAETKTKEEIEHDLEADAV